MKPRAGEARRACYLRVSTDEQRDTGTIATQRDTLRRHAEAYGYQWVGRYEDDGVSISVPFAERSEGRRLLADLRAGRVTHVHVYKLDRLGRGALPTLTAVHQVLDAGGDVISCHEAFDTATPAGQLTMEILASVGGFERATTLQRAMDGLYRHAHEGRLICGPTPYGWRKAAKHVLEPDEDPIPGTILSPAEVVRLMYQLLARGESVHAVARHLSSLQVPAPLVHSGAKATRKISEDHFWSPNSVWTLVRKPSYKGEKWYGRHSTYGRQAECIPIPPLVSPELWEQAQATLQRHAGSHGRPGRRCYLLATLIRCGLCGSSYSGHSTRPTGGPPHTYYRCANRRRAARGTGANCPAPSLRADDVEGTVWQLCLEIIRNPLVALAVQQGAGDAPAVDLSAQLAGIDQELDRRERERARVLGLYRRELISEKELLDQRAQISAEEAALRQRRQEIHAAQASARTAEDIEAEVRAAADEAEHLLAADDPSAETRARIARLLVREIRVLPDAGQLRVIGVGGREFEA